MDNSEWRNYLTEAVRFQLRHFYYYKLKPKLPNYIPQLKHENTRNAADRLQAMVEREHKADIYG